MHEGGVGFYCLRKTAATEIEKINPLVTEMFLAHAERGMKRHYAERHFELLDEALGVMERVVGVARIETGSRRVDVAEFVLWCEGCGKDLAAALTALRRG